MVKRCPECGHMTLDFKPETGFWKCVRTDCGFKFEDPKPLSKAEVDIFCCRLKGALYENDIERIEKIQAEIKERIKYLKILRDGE